MSYCHNFPMCLCAATRTSRIAAHNNAIGPAILYYVPEFKSVGTPQSGRNFGYCAPNDGADPLGWSLRKAIATLEHVNPENVRITGSILECLGFMPRIFGRRTILKIATDFRGYARGADTDIELVDIPVELDAESIDPITVAEAVRGREDPIIHFTFPVTNPGQQAMSLAVVEAALAANDEAIAIIDNAYRGSLEIKGLAQFALSNDRVLYINTASKDLYLCGARFGWAIASKPLLDRLSAALPPYAVGPDAIAQGLVVLALPDALHSARVFQAMARDILVGGLRPLGVRIRKGVGPWVLLFLGSEAEQIVKELAETYLIDVQLQAQNLDGWIRITATVPCEARSIVSAVTELLQNPRMRKLKQVVLTDQIILSEVRR
jgi:histidinol-phosphate/aromatic aminotransferase/cobyric acid decarboxylase-like protein